LPEKIIGCWKRYEQFLKANHNIGQSLLNRIWVVGKDIKNNLVMARWRI